MRLGLGGCGKCMRSAFRATVLSWILTAGCWGYGPPIAHGPAFVLSVLLTSLWIAHILAYAVRRSGLGTLTKQEQISLVHRREILSRFAHSLLAVAAVTALPALLGVPMISRAYAAPRCNDNGTCDCSTTGFGPFGSCKTTCDSCNGERVQCHSGIFGCSCDCQP